MMVGSRLSAAGVHLNGGTVSSASFSFCLSAPLQDSSSFSASWSSPSGCSGTSCSSHLPSPPCDELTRFLLNDQSQPHFFYQLCKRGARGSISSNTNCTCRVLWLMVSVLLFQKAWQQYFIINAVCHVVHLPPSFLLMMARVCWV